MFALSVHNNTISESALAFRGICAIVLFILDQLKCLSLGWKNTLLRSIFAVHHWCLSHWRVRSVVLSSELFLLACSAWLDKSDFRWIHWLQNLDGSGFAVFVGFETLEPINGRATKEQFGQTFHIRQTIVNDKKKYFLLLMEFIDNIFNCQQIILKLIERMKSNLCH